jgi:hypothetical protein
MCYNCACLDAVRKNPVTKHATNAEIENVIKDWLRTASSRSDPTDNASNDLEPQSQRTDMGFNTSPGSGCESGDADESG